jgi:hypothetical protein
VAIISVRKTDKTRPQAKRLNGDIKSGWFDLAMMLSMRPQKSPGFLIKRIEFRLCDVRHKSGWFPCGWSEDANNDLTRAHRQLQQASRQASLQFSVVFLC